jgi:hypothetical protein
MVKGMNFLVTYAAADQAWAEWIAWELEADGYTTMLLAWDPRPDGNFMPLMRDSVERADWIIVVLSAAALASPDAADEWTAALVHHTDGWVQPRFKGSSQHRLVGSRVAVRSGPLRGFSSRGSCGVGC